MCAAPGSVLLLLVVGVLSRAVTNVTDNAIGDDGARELAAGVKKNATLEMLNLGGERARAMQPSRPMQSVQGTASAMTARAPWWRQWSTAALSRCWTYMVGRAYARACVCVCVCVCAPHPVALAPVLLRLLAPLWVCVWVCAPPRRPGACAPAITRSFVGVGVGVRPTPSPGACAPAITRSFVGVVVRPTPSPGACAPAITRSFVGVGVVVRPTPSPGACAPAITRSFVGGDVVVRPTPLPWRLCSCDYSLLCGCGCGCAPHPVAMAPVLLRLLSTLWVSCRQRHLRRGRGRVSAGGCEEYYAVQFEPRRCAAWPPARALGRGRPCARCGAPREGL